MGRKFPSVRGLVGIIAVACTGTSQDKIFHQNRIRCFLSTEFVGFFFNLSSSSFAI